MKLKSKAGFTYLTLMASIVIIGILTTRVTASWTMVRKVDQEAELLFRGREIVRAIESYYRYGHPGMNMFPERLEDLVGHAARPGSRFLRRLYRDPITNGDWEPILEGSGRIVGVRSKSDAEPLKKRNFPKEFKAFEGKTKYSEWHFEYNPAVNRTL
jgi:type II secretory pathway pseudopilin PulG